MNQKPRNGCTAVPLTVVYGEVEIRGRRESSLKGKAEIRGTCVVNPRAGVQHHGQPPVREPRLPLRCLWPTEPAGCLPGAWSIPAAVAGRTPQMTDLRRAEGNHYGEQQ